MDEVKIIEDSILQCTFKLEEPPNKTDSLCSFLAHDDRSQLTMVSH